jgi:hypothetical protein
VRIRLLPEARRVRHRRWMMGTLGAAAAVGVLAAAVGCASDGTAAADAQRAGSTGAPPADQTAALRLAGPLAVAPDGRLYIADVAADRVLERLPDGRFRAVAGTGKKGFSGDGGPAVRADLSDVFDLAFAPDGTLYIADGGRVRVVTPDGIIRTIAGNGRGHYGQAIANDTPALSAPLGSATSMSPDGQALWIALSPSGQLFISTGWQILRLTRSGLLQTVRAVVPSGIGKGMLHGFGPIAVDAHGNIYVGGGPRGWPIWQVTPDGIAHYAGSARQTGGEDAWVQRGADGAVYGENADTIDQIYAAAALRLVPVHMFKGTIGGEDFNLTYFAFGPRGSVYADEVPGNTGFESRQQLVEVSAGRTRVLWEQMNGGQ